MLDLIEESIWTFYQMLYDFNPEFWDTTFLGLFLKDFLFYNPMQTEIMYIFSDHYQTREWYTVSKNVTVLLSILCFGGISFIFSGGESVAQVYVIKETFMYKNGFLCLTFIFAAPAIFMYFHTHNLFH